MGDKAEGMLSPYRVLDLSGETSYLCGKMLADLGADVIKIEPPNGDPGRNQGPFYHDEPDPQKSLFWFAYNTNKRGITLNLETSDGREIFKKLVKTADLVIETFPPGYLGNLGLGYADLEKVNPGIIMVSITPFGQSGPWKDYKAPDIVAWALGGQMYAWGDADRAPVRVSHHSHAHLHTAGDAAIGAVVALYHRGVTGVGQQIDVSILESSVQAGFEITFYWDMAKKIVRRGEKITTGDIKVRQRQLWPCKDGNVVYRFQTGPRVEEELQSFVEWLDSEGMATTFLKEIDWNKLDFRNVTQEFVDQMEAPVAKFFLAHTKAELYAGALKLSIRLYPVATTKDIMEDTQLAFREFWVKLEHPELGTTITYPGAFIKASEAPVRIWRRAPLIGEHNQEIYEKELGISKEQLVILKQTKAI